MTYIVDENCIKCKYMDCVEVCPVDCFELGDGKKLFHLTPKKKISKKFKNNKKTIKIKANNKKNKKIVEKKIRADPNSPFAVLEKLL